MSGPYRVESFGDGVIAEWGVRGPVGAEQSPNWSRKDAREMADRSNRIHEAAASVERARLRARVEAVLAECPHGVVPAAASPAWATLLNETRKGVLREVLALLVEPGEVDCPALIEGGPFTCPRDDAECARCPKNPFALLAEPDEEIDNGSR